jgi:hypothetical protein
MIREWTRVAAMQESSVEKKVQRERKRQDAMETYGNDHENVFESIEAEEFEDRQQMSGQPKPHDQ